MNTVAAVLSSAEAVLAGAGIDTPRLDAEVLLAAALETTRSGLFARLRDPLDVAAERSFATLLDRRQSREPVAHILGGREFWSLWFEVAPSTLVPRPETELLVETALQSLRGIERPRVLDVGTGSGCIAIAIACERPDARVTAVDVSPAALEVARRNAVQHGVADRVGFACFDVCAGRECDPAGFAGPTRASRHVQSFELIVSNPPYVRRDEIDALQAEVRFEPRGALDGGVDGLDVVRALLARGSAWLTPGGQMLIEIGADQGATAVAAARAAGYRDARVLPDLAGLPRLLVVENA